MYQSFGIFLALFWGVSSGIITSIPLGPTGAMVLSSAVENNRKGIFYSIAGLACAQIIFQTIYHLGISRYFVENTGAVLALGTSGIIVTVLFGMNHLRRAQKILVSANSPLQPTGKNQTKGTLGKGPFAKTLSAGLLNPFILIYILANVSMFVTSFPSFAAKGYIIALLFGGLAGTVFWYLLFGELIRRRASLWGKRARFFAELSSGCLMFAAGIFLYLRL